MSSSLDHASGHYALSSSSSSNNNNNNNSNNNNSNSNNPNDHNNSNSNGSHYGISGYPGQQPPPPQQQQQQQQRHNPHHHPQQQQQQQQQQQAQFYYPRQGNQPPPPQQQQQQQQRHPNTPYSQQQQQRLNSPPLPPLGSQYNTSQQDLSRQGHYNKHQQQPFDGYSHSGQPGQQQQVHYQDAQSGRAPPPPPLPSAPSQQHYSPPVGQGYVQESGEQGPASASSASVSGSSPPRSENGSNLRFRITLEAQTAAMQRQDETPVTYLNKGQFYTVGLEDTEEYDGEITSVIKVTFHDASHRRLAARYWSFWLSQQPNPKTARALDIEKASSSGMLEVQSKTFDRISFKWNGKAGAKLMVRFNCLSTDFSRIKGVKGIPLRVHMDTFLEGAGGNSNGGGGGGDLDSSSGMERSFAKIKLFRDKGAERKNKDDHKHLEKMWDKMRGKNADTNPLVNMLAPVQSVSLFSECMDHPEGSGEDETLDLSETLAHDPEADTAVEAGSGGGGGGNGAGSGDGFDVASGSSSRQDSEPFSGDHHSSSGGSLVPVNKKRRRATENGGNALTSGSHNNNNNNNNNNNASSGNNNNSSSNNNNNSSNQRGLYVDPTQSQVGFASSAAASALSSSSTSSTSLTAALVSSSEMFLDRDPNYVAPARKKRPVLCLYIKIGGESVYRAVYLEKYTLADLTQKLSEKLEIQSSTISSVYRKTTTKKELVVRVDDAMVAQMTDELDMVVEYEFNQQDGNVDLTLKY